MGEKSDCIVKMMYECRTPEQCYCSYLAFSTTLHTSLQLKAHIFFQTLVLKYCFGDSFVVSTKLYMLLK